MEATIAAVLSFNRFCTRLTRALDPRFPGSEITPAEARLLFEIAHMEHPSAADLQTALDMDAGYVSRLVGRFETRGWIARERGQGKGDADRRLIQLTPQGRSVLDRIDLRQRETATEMLERLGPVQRADLITALGLVRALLDPVPGRSFSIRGFRTGDMGLIAARQSILYAQSQGWERQLEIIEGEVTTAFLRNFKPGREQCWVAEVDGAMAGSVFLTDEGDGLARLRLLYVEPFARGRGIGDRLVDTCVGFAREKGYSAIILWTHTILESARRIYAAHGFEIVETAVHEEFGRPVHGETWRLDLRTPPVRISSDPDTSFHNCIDP